MSSKARKKESCYEEGPFSGSLQIVASFRHFELTDGSLLAFFVRNFADPVRTESHTESHFRPGPRLGPKVSRTLCLS
jgi:hypothetical protein